MAEVAAGFVAATVTNIGDTATLEHEADRLERKLQEPMHPQTAKQLKRLLKNCLKNLEQVK